MVTEFDIGVEIEAIFNYDLFENMNFGEYHEGEYFGLNKWTAECDSSLYIPSSEDSPFDSPESIEFVSGVFNGKKKFLKGIDNFIKYFSDNGRYKLSDVMYFNKTCGSHLHFSFSNGDLKGIIHKKIYYKLFEKLRNDFFKKLKKSKIKSKDEIKKHYFREYSSNLMKLGNYKYWKNDRQTEFNILSEQRGMGMEWRSLNLRGIESWDEFQEFWEIVYSCLENFSKYAFKYQIREDIDFISEKELERLEAIKNSEIIKEEVFLKGVTNKKRYSRFEIDYKGNFKMEKEQIKQNEIIKEELECVI